VEQSRADNGAGPVGRATFALIGATKAAQADLGAFAIIFLATLTAVGGGLLRDVSIREVPQIFYRDFYASPAIFLGVMYSILAREETWEKALNSTVETWTKSRPCESFYQGYRES